jgi:hypothetical protein
MVTLGFGDGGQDGENELADPVACHVAAEATLGVRVIEANTPGDLRRISGVQPKGGSKHPIHNRMIAPR